MKEIFIELVILGGGPAGMAAAISAHDMGIIATIIERDEDLGGILQQCIHSGFGLHVFNEELTGPEFGERYKKLILEKKIPFMLNTIVTGISKDKMLIAFNPNEGLLHIRFKALILAMGARERSRGTIKIPGARPSGIYTAGLAQRLINIEGRMPGNNVVILGSGDIGMIMARRLTLEGAKVIKVVEILPYPSGLLRNKVQCLDDFNIPLLLEHTVTHIHEKDGRVQGVTISKVDNKWISIPGSEKYVACDTLLLSVGLIPEIEFALDLGIELARGGGPIVDESLETTIPGIFACGNVLHIHDLVDNVVIEGIRAGISATSYIKNQIKRDETIPVIAGNGILYVVPHKIKRNAFLQTQTFQLRVQKPDENLIIGIKSGKDLLRKNKVLFAMPSEMISITLPPVERTHLIKDEITILTIKD